MIIHSILESPSGYHCFIWLEYPKNGCKNLIHLGPMFPFYNHLNTRRTLVFRCVEHKMVTLAINGTQVLEKLIISLGPLDN